MYQHIGTLLGDVIPFLVGLYLSLRYLNILKTGPIGTANPPSNFMKGLVYLGTVLLAILIITDLMK
jgi:hypothetical protein